MPATAVADAVADCKAIVDFAAETHVDRSISGAREFATTNMQGTEVLLEAARAKRRRYLEVSTDEVYGSIESGSFSESPRPLLIGRRRRAPTYWYRVTHTATGLTPSSAAGRTTTGPTSTPR